MTSFKTSLVFVFIAFFLSSVAGSPLEIIAARDVFVPPVLAPNETSVWKVGTNQTVTWNVSNPPKNITNPRATIILVKNSTLDLDHPLAKDIDILSGSVNVTVPYIMPNETGPYYQIIVFGDSGNTGQIFKIES